MPVATEDQDLARVEAWLPLLNCVKLPDGILEVTLFVDEDLGPPEADLDVERLLCELLLTLCLSIVLPRAFL